jgi:hypothetical protein
LEVLPPCRRERAPRRRGARRSMTEDEATRLADGAFQERRGTTQKLRTGPAHGRAALRYFVGSLDCGTSSATSRAARGRLRRSPGRRGRSAAARRRRDRLPAVSRAAARAQDPRRPRRLILGDAGAAVAPEASMSRTAAPGPASSSPGATARTPAAAPAPCARGPSRSSSTASATTTRSPSSSPCHARPRVLGISTVGRNAVLSRRRTPRSVSSPSRDGRSRSPPVPTPPAAPTPRLTSTGIGIRGAPLPPPSPRSTVRPMARWIEPRPASRARPHRPPGERRAPPRGAPGRLERIARLPHGRVGDGGNITPAASSTSGAPGGVRSSLPGCRSR